jgi:hypothetical protein
VANLETANKIAAASAQRFFRFNSMTRGIVLAAL